VTKPDGTLIEYVIDAQNRRVGKKINGTLTRQYLYSDALRIVAELDGTGNIVSRFIYATRSNVPDLMQNGGAIYRIVSDHLGSPRLVVNAFSGDVVERIDYDEFGIVTNDTNPGFTPFGFAGGLYDQDTKLVRFGARDYDATVGRWTAKDDTLFNDGINIYKYSNNEPVDFIDTEGRASVKVTAAKGRGGAITVGRDNGQDFVQVQAGLGYGGGIKFDPFGRLPRPPDNSCPPRAFLGFSATGSLSIGPISFDWPLRAGIVIYQDADGKLHVAEGNDWRPKLTLKWKEGWGLGASGLAGGDVGVTTDFFKH
jgi:RHS repeat-associated protein